MLFSSKRNFVEDIQRKLASTYLIIYKKAAYTYLIFIKKQQAPTWLFTKKKQSLILIKSRNTFTTKVAVTFQVVFSAIRMECNMTTIFLNIWCSGRCLLSNFSNCSKHLPESSRQMLLQQEWVNERQSVSILFLIFAIIPTLS